MVSSRIAFTIRLEQNEAVIKELPIKINLLLQVKERKMGVREREREVNEKHQRHEGDRGKGMKEIIAASRYWRDWGCLPLVVK
jgi:hypothetical protein